MRLSFDDAFRGEFAALHRYLRRRFGADLADDLAAETFATAYSNWHRFDQTRPPRPWLYGIAANLVRHHRRDEQRSLRAYARTGIDPVLASEEGDIVRRLGAQARQRE